MDIQIREATKGDLPFIRAMIWEALLASPTLIQHVGIEKIQQHEDKYWNNWEKKQDPSFIAVDNNQQNIRAILLYPNDEKPVESYRIGMGVIKKARGKGVGKLLIERALQFARRNNCIFSIKRGKRDIGSPQTAP